MNDQIIKSKWIECIELIFKIEFLFYVCLSYNNLFFGKPILSVFVILSVLLGGIIILFRLINWKTFINTKNIVFLVLFIISYVITLLVNIKYGFMPGLKTLVWTGLQLFILYAYDSSKKIEEYKREFRIISNCYIYYMLIAAIWSFVQFILGYSTIKSVSSDGYVVPSGFMWGRLWGVFNDPNQGSVFACIALILSIYFIIEMDKQSAKSKLFLAVNSINILAQVLYITFSDSRTGLIGIAVGLACLTYLYSLKRIKLRKNILKYASCLTLSIVIFFTGFITPVLIKNANNFIQLNFIVSGNGEDQSKYGVIGREEDIKDDISNRRFDIWKSSLQIYSTKPILGVSHTNLIPYAKAKLPDTYLVNNPQYSFETSHNLYLDVLSGQGAVGFIIFILFAFGSIIYIFRRIRWLKVENYMYASVLLTCIVIIVASTFFITEILYVNSQIGYIFWLFLGYLIHMLHKQSKDKTETKNKSLGENNE